MKLKAKMTMKMKTKTCTLQPTRQAASPPRAWTLEQLAESYHCSTRTLLRQVKRGELVATRPGRSFVVLEADVHAWLERRAVHPSAQSEAGVAGQSRRGG